MLRDSLTNQCVTRVLACINPGTIQFVETRNVLTYVQRASCLAAEEPEEIDEAAAGQGQAGQTKGTAEDFHDPMADDVFDTDEIQNRRVEMISTSTFGSVFARCRSAAGRA
eukprot:3180393-Prymnesium_polylepis.1